VVEWSRQWAKAGTVVAQIHAALASPRKRVAVRRRLRGTDVLPGKALVGYDVFAGAHARMAASKRDLASGPRANGLMIGKSIPD
jgi:hypothetical protein